MRTGLMFVSVVVVVFLAETTSAGFFDWPCPAYCASRTCTQAGCTSCLPGYYVYYIRRTGICTSTCPRGYYENHIGWCTKCGTRNCEDCSARYTCTECSRRYELDGNGGCRRE